MVYVDGSFITLKPSPGDYDGCRDAANIDKGLVDPVLYGTSHARRAQKWLYRGGDVPPEA